MKSHVLLSDQVIRQNVIPLDVGYLSSSEDLLLPLAWLVYYYYVVVCSANLTWRHPHSAHILGVNFQGIDSYHSRVTLRPCNSRFPLLIIFPFENIIRSVPPASLLTNLSSKNRVTTVYCLSAYDPALPPG